MDLLLLIIITIITGFVSLCGDFLLLSNSRLATWLQKFGSYIAVLVIAYAVFADIIPEASESDLGLGFALLFTAIGFVAFFLISIAMRHLHVRGETTRLRNRRQAIFMIIVDTLHTIADGITIGVSFAAGISTGILAATATAAHEIPQEIADFAILARTGMSKRRVILWQSLVALILLPSAIFAYFIGDALMPHLPVLLSLAAGFLLFIMVGELTRIVKDLKNR